MEKRRRWATCDTEVRWEKGSETMRIRSEEGKTSGGAKERTTLEILTGDVDSARFLKFHFIAVPGTACRHAGEGANGKGDPGFQKRIPGSRCPLDPPGLGSLQWKVFGTSGWRHSGIGMLGAPGANAGRRSEASAWLSSSFQLELPVESKI